MAESGARVRSSRVGALLLAVAGALAVLLLALGAPSAVRAQVTAGAAAATSKDPTAITFAQRITAPGGVRAARFEYRVTNPDGDVGGSAELPAPAGNEFDVSYTLETRTAQRYIPVGSQFRYQWLLTLQDGTTFRTREESYLFLDGRYQWRERSDGPVTVYWYGNNESAANGVLRAVKAAFEESQELLQARVQYPIRVVVYASEEDGKLAMRPTSRTFEEQVRTGGQRVAPDLLFVFDARADVVRHETAHIVTHVAGDGPFAQVPSWLDEGTAVYMQPEPGPYRIAVEAAVRGDRTLSLRSMQTPATRPNEVDIFYGQAWSTVDFLIREYGRAKFAELYKTVHDGARIDDALQRVYGFNQDGLYNAWRRSKGLQPVDVSGPTAPTAAAAQGTRAPLGVPTSGAAAGQSTPAAGGEGTPAGQAGAAADEDGGDSNVVGALVLLGVTVLLAGGLGGAAFMLLRRRRPAGAA